LKNKLLWAILPMALLIAGCASPKEQKDEAEAEFIEQKTATIEEYKDCIKEAGTDEPKLNACESLLKAVQGLAAPAE
jgi:PBP1b-binding outer membrane lipoprotein LpoB